MNELKQRGLGDILIAVVDGLKGFPEAINAAFPETVVQTCIVHLIRHSLEFVSWKDRKPVVPALRAIYRVRDAEAGFKVLDALEAGDWGQLYPAIALIWRQNWTQVVPFFAYPKTCVGLSTRRMTSTSVSSRHLLFSSRMDDHVAKNGDRGCKLRHAAIIVVPRLWRPCAVWVRVVSTAGSDARMPSRPALTLPVRGPGAP